MPRRSSLQTAISYGAQVVLRKKEFESALKAKGVRERYAMRVAFWDEFEAAE